MRTYNSQWVFRSAVLTTVGLLLFGQIILYSATGVMGLQKYSSEFYFVLRQATAAGTGLVFMFILSTIPFQFWEKLSPLLFFLQIVITFAALYSPFAHVAQGVNRWIRIGPLTIQPSEMAKLTVSLYGAYLISRTYRKPWTAKALFGFLTPIPILLFLIYKQPDMGSTVILACILFGLIFLSGIRVSYLAILLGSGASLVAFGLMQSAYRRERILAFLNPWGDPQGRGFQSIQSFLSFHSGKIFGLGLGNGNSKLFYLPEVHTDFIFALIGEELGFLGALAVLLVFAFLCHLLLKTVKYAPDPFSRALAFALSTSLILQILINLAGVTGLLPVKGLPLPFISWGRSSLITTLASMGILLNIIRQSGPRNISDIIKKGDSVD